ncbi:MAG: ribonuclease P protein component 1 [Candidatus Nanohaloarchaeota archaeon QJJ-7]|nr:ribonuclease P protein component 1 [Candidatus Nanohaloarchaeota archaeon QJJ-7]
MSRSVENLVRHELIGLDTEVLDSSDPGTEGIEGKVVDETRQTLVIDSGGEEKTVPKEDTRFRFRLEEAEIDVEGDILVARPEERILKKFPRKWEYTD